MKRVLLTGLAVCLLLTLAACGRTAPPAPTPTAAPEATPAPTPEPTPSPTPAPTPEPLPLAPSLPPVHDEALSGIFESVLTVYPSTAGCSLRAAVCAALLLDWGSETELTDDEIYSAVGCWLDEQDDKRLQIFLESILLVYDMSYDLRGEYAQGLMDSAGIVPAHAPWGERAVHAVEMVVYGCGLR